MQLQQVNFTYHPNEDRILMRITANEKDEIRIWLTRKSLTEFVPQATKWLNPANGTSQSTVQSFKREQAAVSADTTQPLRAGNNFPLGEAPILAVSLVIESENNVSRMVIDFINKQRITLNLAEEALAGIQKILFDTINVANWNLTNDGVKSNNFVVSSPSLTKH